MPHDQRGQSESVQWALLWPAILLVSLGIIQAGIYLHGRNVAQRAATAAVDTARGTYGSAGEARQRAENIARAGGLRSVTVVVDRGTEQVRAQVRGDPVSLIDLGLSRVSETATAPRERFTRP